MTPRKIFTAAAVTFFTFTTIPAFAAAYITSEQAVKAAQTKVKNSRVFDVDFERDTRPHYDVTLVSDGKKYEVRVDAKSGKAVIINTNTK